MAEKQKYRELTPASLAGGVLVGLLLNMGICFAGLQIGFTIVGSTVAAVLGFGLLRGVLRKGSILEVNIFQTVASSVNTVNAGVIFTIPVLFLMDLQDKIDYLALALAVTAGSVLGVVMIIPLRKQIIELERLRFPSAVAVAAILKSPGAGVEKAWLLVLGILVSASVSLGTILSGIDSVPVGQFLGLPAGIHFVFAISLLSFGAGYLAGKPGLAILYGTLLNFWFLIPLCITFGWVPEEFAGTSLLALTYEDVGGFIHKFQHFTSRHLGIGMILGGAIAGIAIALPALKAAIASLRSPPEDGPREEVSLRTLNTGMAIGFLLLLLATKLSGGENVSWPQAVLAAAVGGIWLWLSGLVVAQTTGRTDWSPLSGLALLATVIMMAILGTDNNGIIPAVTVGAAICVATSMCADMMADLKTGYLIGSRPARQQVAQIATCWMGPAVSVATVVLLWNANAFGPEQARILYERKAAEGPEALTAYEQDGGSETKLAKGIPQLGAPQAAALESAIRMVKKATSDSDQADAAGEGGIIERLEKGGIPVYKYIAGATIGLLVSLLISPGLGVMIGLSLYLPFEYMIVFGLGGILSIFIGWKFGARFAEDKGVPIAAGLIVGDALVGIVHAIYKVAVMSLGG
ncbi:MAG: OPT/YSL family transporter [Planctomycetota bacterium]|nr:OPT/YSL family transporter [Planctomycetota bacterium]